ncbi:MAG: serine hydrolase [Byssovorax sp.]
MMSGLLLALGACTAAPRPEGTSSAPAPEASDARTAPPSTPPADPPAPAPPPSSPRGAAAPARPGVAIHTFDEAAEGAILREEVPGAVILVIQRGEVVHRRAYGLRRKEPSATPMTVDTVFDLASLTSDLHRPFNHAPRRAAQAPYRRPRLEIPAFAPGR